MLDSTEITGSGEKLKTSIKSIVEFSIQHDRLKYLVGLEKLFGNKLCKLSNYHHNT